MFGGYRAPARDSLPRSDLFLPSGKKCKTTAPWVLSEVGSARNIQGAQRGLSLPRRGKGPGATPVPGDRSFRRCVHRRETSCGGRRALRNDVTLVTRAGQQTGEKGACAMSGKPLVDMAEPS